MCDKLPITVLLLLSCFILPGLQLDRNDVEEIIDKKLNTFEQLLVARYNLIRRCIKPKIMNGYTTCKPGKNAKKRGDLPPGTVCDVVCDIGYIATPGNHTTKCLEGGFWSHQLSCEIPLVLVSGGRVDSVDTETSTLEIISPLPSQGCTQTFFPNLPDDPKERKFHNLMYMSPNMKLPSTVLVCNGLSSHPYSSCVSWSPGETSWKIDYDPNKRSYMDMIGSMDLDWNNKKKKVEDFKLGTVPLGKPLEKVSRYASSSVEVRDSVMMIGGMVNSKPSHKVVDMILVTQVPGPLEEGNWKHISTGGYPKDSMHLIKPRAFFCTVRGFSNSHGFFSIGGFSGSTIEKSAEWMSYDSGFMSYSIKSKNIPDMPGPRSGHGCTGLPDSRQLLVSGGSQDEGSPALSSSLLYSVSSGNMTIGKWKPTGSMNEARFGHAIVTVAGRVFAIGGNQRKPDKVTDTVEEYNVDDDTWSYLPQKMKTPRTNFGYTLVPHSIFPGCKVQETPKIRE